MIKWVFNVRKKLILFSLYIEIAWLRLKRQKVEMMKSEFIVYTLILLLIGLGLGMVWRTNQVEPNLKAQIAILEESKIELTKAFMQKYP